MIATAEKKEITADDIKQLDAERSALAMLPSAEELFPAMLPERAEWYRRQLSFMAIGNFTGTAEAFWWGDLLGPRDRVFVLRHARLDRGLAIKAWRDLLPDQRCRVICAFMWLHDWVGQFQPPMQPMRDLAIKGEW